MFLQVNSGYIMLGQDCLDKHMLFEFMSICQVKPGYFRLNHVSPCYVSLGLVLPG